MTHFICNRCLISKPEADFSELARAQARENSPDAMCQQCIDSLFRSRLGRDEVDAYLKEDEDRRLAKYRLPDQENRKDSPARWGRVMHHSEFINQLQNAIPNLQARDGNLPGDISLCRNDGDRLTYICYSNSGYLPEYSIVHVNDQNLPVREQRGWRTVLLRLIKCGLVNEEQALKYFGEPSNGEAAKFYKAELAYHRNTRNLGNG
jgi:hypothetical protein